MLTYESIYDAFRDVGSERLRLEFKENLDAEELARQAVAMANGDGGIVICGFKDPVEGAPLTPSDFLLAVDEPARRRLMSKIQSKVYPSVPIDCAGYTAADGTHRLLLMRVEPSDVAPHERLNDRGRFIVRRGTETTGMTLRELELLIRDRDRQPPRRSSDPNDYGLEAARAGGSRGLVSFQRDVPEKFIGATVHPEDDARNDPLSRSRQKEIERFVRRLDGLNAAVPQTYTDGVLSRTRQNPARERDCGRPVWVDALGEGCVRWCRWQRRNPFTSRQHRLQERTNQAPVYDLRARLTATSCDRRRTPCLRFGYTSPR